MLKKIVLLLIFISFFGVSYADNVAKKPPLGSSIDWSNPISKQIVLCYLFNEIGSGKLYSLVNENHNTITNVSWDNEGLIFDNTSKKVTLTRYLGVPANNFNAMSIMCIFRADVIENMDMLVSNWYGTTTARRWYLGLSGTDSVVFYKTEAGYGTPYSWTSPLTISAGQKIVAICGGAPASTSGFISVNGIYSTTRASASAVGAISSYYAPTIGSQPSSSGNMFAGKIYMVVIWKRKLSKSEAITLGRDPYCFIRRNNFGYFKGGVSGGAVDMGQVIMVM